MSIDNQTKFHHRQQETRLTVIHRTARRLDNLHGGWLDRKVFFRLATLLAIVLAYGERDAVLRSHLRPRDVLS